MYPPQTWHRASYSSKYCLFWGYLSGLFKKQAHQSVPRRNTLTPLGRREERSTVHHCSLPVRSLLAVVTVQKVNWLGIYMKSWKISKQGTSITYHINEKVVLILWTPENFSGLTIPAKISFLFFSFKFWEL